jgi:SOS response regulatory protein OraA/RecX
VREAYGVYELRAKILTFLTQKGFEAELAQDVYKQVLESDGRDLNI